MLRTLLCQVVKTSTVTSVTNTWSNIIIRLASFVKNRGKAKLLYSVKEIKDIIILNRLYRKFK